MADASPAGGLLDRFRPDRIVRPGRPSPRRRERRCAGFGSGRAGDAVTGCADPGGWPRPGEISARLREYARPLPDRGGRGGDPRRIRGRRPRRSAHRSRSGAAEPHPPADAAGRGLLVRGGLSWPRHLRPHHLRHPHLAHRRACGGRHQRRERLAIGLVAGYVRWVDTVAMRAMDGVMAIPGVLLAKSPSSRLPGPGLATSSSRITIPEIRGWSAWCGPWSSPSASSPTWRRRSRAGPAAQDPVDAHPAPNTVAPLIVQATYVCASAIVIEAILSFLGAGTPPEIPSWGNIMAEGRVYVQVAPWMIFFPRRVPGRRGPRRQHPGRRAPRFARPPRRPADVENPMKQPCMSNPS